MSSDFSSETLPTSPHTPVLLQEVLEALSPHPGGVYLDGTFGAGGYTEALLTSVPDSTVLALDRDPDAIALGNTLKERFKGRLLLHRGCFGDLATHVRHMGYDQIDGVMLDIGVSSQQLDAGNRGFSFRHEGPLDMRMSQEGPTAADLVNTASEADLADIFYFYGEERKARLIARRLVRRRATHGPFLTTSDFAGFVASVVGGGGAHHPARRVFQALRIAVNDELGELVRALHSAEEIIKPGGRLVVVTFHSLEDRIVKRFLVNRARELKKKTYAHTMSPMTDVHRKEPWQQVHKKPIVPTDQECTSNRRARSAKLRVAERTDAPSWAMDESVEALSRTSL
jgi:16S rRNA (cytosine1402-N4)-methyltransferase